MRSCRKPRSAQRWSTQHGGDVSSSSGRRNAVNCGVRYEQQLVELVRADEWLMDVLRAARVCDPPNWLIGSGVLRNLVWDHLHGYAERTPARDVDLAYFDPLDLRPEAENAWERRLHAIRPDVPWEVKNQAAVHLWYERRFGYAVPRLDSIQAAVATWPETATAIALRLLADDQIELIAPFGLADLFQMILRRNPTRVSVEEYQRRYASKRIRERWPHVQILEH